MKNRKKLILLVAVTVIVAVGCLGLTACGLFESDPAPTPVVENKNVDMSGVTFVDQTFDYDGTEKSLLISGSLPEGVTGVTYTGNGKKEVGVHIVTASFNVNDGYNKPADMTAKLTISAIDVTGEIVFEDAEYTYDGTAKELYVKAPFPKGISRVSYTINGKSGNTATDAGEYTVVAEFTMSEGYNQVDSVSAKLTINKAAINTGAIVFNDKAFRYDGTSKSLTVGALPAGIESVSYTIDGKVGNSATEVGEYNVTANFTVNKNYLPIESQTAILTIEKPFYDISGVVFENKTVKGDGSAQSIVATNLPFDDIVVEYTYIMSGTTTETSESPTATGVYQVKATLIGNEEYLDTKLPVATLTITKKRVLHVVEPNVSNNLASYDVWVDNNNKVYIIENLTILKEGIDVSKYFFAIDEEKTAIINDLETLNSEEFVSGFSKHFLGEAIIVNRLDTVSIVDNQMEVGSITGVQNFRKLGMIMTNIYIKDFILNDGYYLKINNVYKNTFSIFEKQNLFENGVNSGNKLTAYQSKTVTLKTNGGSIANNEYTTFDTTYPSNFNTENAPSKTGHTFGGWYTDIELNNIVTGETRVNNGATLYAKWTANEITVNFDANGGVTVEGTTVTYGNNLTVAAATTRTGYIFAGWNTAKNGSGTNYNAEATVAISVLSDKDAVTLYAQWTAITYTVKFDANGGTGTMESMTFTYDETQQLIKNTFVNAEREFIEWNTKSDGNGTGYADTASVSNLADTQDASVILYAIWAAGSYSIEFVGGAGVQGNMAVQKIATDSTDAKISLNQFTKTGYTFAGWTTAEGGTEVEYADGATLSKALADSNQTVSLYAVWTENQYKIQFVNEHSYATGTLPSDMTYKYTESKALTSMTFTLGASYAFIGWTQSQDGSGTLYSDGATVSQLTAENNAVIKLYAQFKVAKINIEYVYNDGVANGNNPTSVSYDDEIAISDPKCTLDEYRFLSWTIYDGNNEIRTSYDINDDVKKLATIANDGKTYTLKANYYNEYWGMGDGGIVFHGKAEKNLVVPTSLIVYQNGVKRTEENFTKFETMGGVTTGCIRIPASFTYININANMATFAYIFIESVDNITTFYTEGEGIEIVFAQSKEIVDAKITSFWPNDPTTCWYNGVRG